MQCHDDVISFSQGQEEWAVDDWLRYLSTNTQKRVSFCCKRPINIQVWSPMFLQKCIVASEDSYGFEVLMSSRFLALIALGVGYTCSILLVSVGILGVYGLNLWLFFLECPFSQIYIPIYSVFKTIY